MGTASIEVSAALAARLKAPPFAGAMLIVEEKDAGDGFVRLTVRSPLLDPDCEACQEIVVDGDALRFKPARDHDIGAGRPFKMETQA